MQIDNYGKFESCLKDITNFAVKVQTNDDLVINEVLRKIKLMNNIHPNLNSIWIYSSWFGTHLLKKLEERIISRAITEVPIPRLGKT